ncbi:hypothetical protein QBC47DRAFT_184147 [Echria macrotheca]|uniref:Uncharacterized protein n=1 Tax=Echria macrotheca TaxID=438768 RepID=A0AAJ0F718_9PEZI|nr:hypothetical protein QBC47DRAFT_184147 [Echria macrotheca]
MGVFSTVSRRADPAKSTAAGSSCFPAVKRKQFISDRCQFITLLGSPETRRWPPPETLKSHVPADRTLHHRRITSGSRGSLDEHHTGQSSTIEVTPRRDDADLFSLFSTRCPVKSSVCQRMEDAICKTNHKPRTTHSSWTPPSSAQAQRGSECTASAPNPTRLCNLLIVTGCEGSTCRANRGVTDQPRDGPANPRFWALAAAFSDVGSNADEGSTLSSLTVSKSRPREPAVRPLKFPALCPHLDLRHCASRFCAW